MAYNVTFTGDDLSNVMVDGVVKVAIAIGSFATILGLFIIYLYFKKKVK